jgi:hypothetical protein
LESTKAKKPERSEQYLDQEPTELLKDRTSIRSAPAALVAAALDEPTYKERA